MLNVQPLDITFHLCICLGRVLRGNKKCWETQKGENKCTRCAKGVWGSWDWQKPVLGRASRCNHFLHLAHSPGQCHRRAVRGQRAREAQGRRSHLPLLPKGSSSTLLKTPEGHFLGHPSADLGLTFPDAMEQDERGPWGSACPLLVPEQELRRSMCHSSLLYLCLPDQTHPLYLKKKEKKKKKAARRAFIVKKRLFKCLLPPSQPQGGGSGLLQSWKTGGQSWPGVRPPGAGSPRGGCPKPRGTQR